MTQSDAPNEGREEKKAEQFFLKKFGCTSKAKVMQEHFIGLSVIHKCIDAIEEYAADQLSKEREFNDKLKQGLENGSERWKKHLELENKVLKDQLEKERETSEQIKKSFGQIVHDLKMDLQKERKKVGELENEVKRLEGLLVEDEEIMTSDSEELQKEREMRKELVDTLKEIYEYITDEGILEDLAGVEELIERASELDKNQ